jgi:ribonuclease HII
VLIYAGIDEAGYGPMLGPLCVASTVFVLEEHEPADGAPDMWALLEEAVCRSRRDRRHRIAVDDSKKLKSARSATVHPCRHLERGVLSFLPLIDAPDALQLPADDEALLTRLGATAPGHRWYAFSHPLPVGQSADELHITARRLQRAMEAQSIRMDDLALRLVDAHDLNREYERTGSKAAVNMHAVLQLVQRIWEKHGEAHPRIMIDRQGGRQHYLRELQIAWPEAHHHVIAESEALSRYRVEAGARVMTLSFCRGGDGRHLPIALASMTAKYVRELMMLRLNRYFRQFVVDLKPTAGYVQDARRYLRDIDAVIRSQAVAREALVRCV